jgi:hypothetical protein
MSRFLPAMFLTIAVLLPAAPALADIMLEFDASEYDVAPGDTVSVAVYLHQTPGGSQIGAGNELLAASIRVEFDNPPVPSDPAFVASVLDITGSALFDASSASVTPGQYADLALTSLLGVNVDSNGDIALGTFVFTAGMFPGEVTHISVSELPTGANFITAGGDILTPTGSDATINVVPEPSSLTLVLIALPLTIGLGVRSRMSRAAFLSISTLCLITTLGSQARAGIAFEQDLSTSSFALQHQFASSSYSSSQQLYDDFSLSQSSTIGSIEWWGHSGRVDQNDASATVPISFTLGIYTTTGSSYSARPDLTSPVFVEDVSVVGTLLAGSSDPNLFDFTADIGPVSLQAGTNYFVTVFEDKVDSGPLNSGQWFHWAPSDASGSGGALPGTNVAQYTLYNGSSTTITPNRAFTLSTAVTVPEPSAAILILTALPGVLLVSRTIRNAEKGNNEAVERHR